MTENEARKVAEELLVPPSCPECKVQLIHARDSAACLVCGYQRNWHLLQSDRITTALLSAARVPDGCAREGVTDRKVLGTLPLTADGCVCGAGGKVYVNSMVQKQVIECEVRDGRFGWLTSPLCYSTRDAALAARKEGAKDE